MLNRIPGLIRRTRNRAVTANTLARFLGAGGDMAPTGITEDGAGNLAAIVNLAMSGYVEAGEIATPSSPASNLLRSYVKNSGGVGRPFFVDSGGTEQQLAGMLAIGTWTPLMQFGGASVGITYTNQKGSYIRIGRLVLINFRVTLSAKGSSTGNAGIAGLPVAASTSLQAGTDGIATFVFSSWGNITGFTSGNLFGLIGSGGGATLILRIGSGNTPTSLTDANFTATTDFFGEGFYFTDAT